MKELFILVYNNQGEFNGFYGNNEEEKNIVKSIIEKDEALSYCLITEPMHDYMFQRLPHIKVDIDTIKDSETTIDNTDYFEEIEISLDTTINIDLIKSRLIKRIKSKCNEFIINGLQVELSNGESKEFSFKIEDQINLKSILENHSSEDNIYDIIYYHANGEFDSMYSYEDICLIYKTLYNNKVYNLTYTQVLCEWISDNYNEEMYNNKEIIIDYGYSNEEIIKKVDERYESQKIS